MIVIFIQILLLDKQKCDIEHLCGNPEDADRSFLFLLQPRDDNLGRGDVTVRVTLAEMLTSLISHNIMLQIIGTLLLQDTKHVVPRY